VRFVAATIAFIAATLFAAVSQFAGAAQTSPLAPGDQLHYAIAVELQQHHVVGTGKNADKVTESSAQGTATFTIYSIERDGTALATVALNLAGTYAGQPVALQTAAPAKIMPDGQLRIAPRLGLGISDALAAANTTVGEMHRHEPLAPGETWSNAAKTPFITVTITRKITGSARYHGWQALTLQSVGIGSLLRTADGRPVSGSISVGGTTYYDGDNHLLIGEAIRTLTVVAQPGSRINHDDYSSTFNVVLDAWDHPSPAPQTSAQATAEPSPEESATPAPTPLPPLYSTPYPSALPSMAS
jgi:hypothetical protein